MDEKKETQEITVYALKADEMPVQTEPKSGRSTALGYKIIGAAMAYPGRPILITDHQGGSDEELYRRIKNRTIHQGMRGFLFQETTDRKQFIITFDLKRFNKKTSKGIKNA